MTPAMQPWSAYHTAAVVVGAVVILVMVLWFVGAGRRKRRKKPEGKVIARAAQAGRARVTPQVPLYQPRARHEVAGEASGHAAVAPPAPAAAPPAPVAGPGLPSASAVATVAAPLPPVGEGRGADSVPQIQVEPAPGPSPCAGDLSARVQLSLDGDSGPVFTPPPLVEELPDVARQRQARDTPRAPTVVTGSSIGAYRMVRPSEPDVFTPPPTPTPTPGARAAGDTPGPRRPLSLSAKLRRIEVASTRTPVPGTSTPGEPVGCGACASAPALPASATPGPAASRPDGAPDKPGK